ncbi:hypothetical protein [Geomicrobium sp. JCM 19039]|uniref:hypothetical protein n=1 Tax=Geomicrobium sp. JCM 19039 TaxID=1460636 RepID=UPI0005A6A7F1|nr:hypothetical protein [Geomicrobium sp. JCM 19039]
MKRKVRDSNVFSKINKNMNWDEKRNVTVKNRIIHSIRNNRRRNFTVNRSFKYAGSIAIFAFLFIGTFVYFTNDVSNEYSDTFHEVERSVATDDRNDSISFSDTALDQLKEINDLPFAVLKDLPENKQILLDVSILESEHRVIYSTYGSVEQKGSGEWAVAVMQEEMPASFTIQNQQIYIEEEIGNSRNIEKQMIGDQIVYTDIRDGQRDQVWIPSEDYLFNISNERLTEEELYSALASLEFIQ